MTDRELLKLAAKAAGIPLKPDFAERYDYYMADKLMWNPLTDDGDALRLAVHLQMMIDFIKDGAWHERYKQNHVVAVGDGESHYESIEPDPYAATRRAIVRAAAEIGRNMK